jgi:hypothetical protein
MLYPTLQRLIRMMNVNWGVKIILGDLQVGVGEVAVLLVGGSDWVVVGGGAALDTPSYMRQRGRTLWFLSVSNAPCDNTWGSTRQYKAVQK